MKKTTILNGPCNCGCHDIPGTVHIVPCCMYTYQSRVSVSEKVELLKNLEGMITVGVVGYCPPTKFNEGDARILIISAYDRIATTYQGQKIAIVSGLTNVGVLRIAYEEAVKRGWETVGIACEKANDHPIFPVDFKLIIGKDWGDESSFFTSTLDTIIRIGSGKQSIAEANVLKQDGRPTIEYDLLALPSYDFTGVPPKFPVGGRVKVTGWVSSNIGTILEIKRTFHNRLGEWVWGYRILYDVGDSPITYTFVPQGYLQAIPDAKYPPVSPGTLVKTTHANHDIKDWTPEGLASRQWDVKGKVVTHHDSHGLTYEVRHPDGTIGHYDPSEFELV